jgi:hypothetical protein
MTTLEDVGKLVLAGRANLGAANLARLGDDAAALRQAAEYHYAQADTMLQGEPLESVHPGYGTGILVGVNQSGWALFHPDNADHPFPVDVFELREVA